MEEIVLDLNSQFFQFNLSRPAPMQYAVHEASEQSHFDRHVDYGREKGHRVTPVTQGPRKSLVIWAQGPEYR